MEHKEVEKRDVMSIESYDNDDSSTFIDGFPPEIFTLESTPNGNDYTKIGQSEFSQSALTYTLIFGLDI